MVAVRTVREEERMPTAGENQLNTMFLIPIRYWEDDPLRAAIMVAVRTIREEERMPTAGENQLNTMFLIPIRYWEDGPLREVEPLELSEMHVYGKEAAEEQPMYYSRDMCFYSRQKAQEARELLTKLLEVRRRDAIEYLVARLTATL